MLSDKSLVNRTQTRRQIRASVLINNTPNSTRPSKIDRNSHPLEGRKFFPRFLPFAKRDESFRAYDSGAVGSGRVTSRMLNYVGVGGFRATRGTQEGGEQEGGRGRGGGRRVNW